MLAFLLLATGYLGNEVLIFDFLFLELGVDF